jgi:hypothetical protein
MAEDATYWKGVAEALQKQIRDEGMARLNAQAAAIVEENRLAAEAAKAARIVQRESDREELRRAEWLGFMFQPGNYEYLAKIGKAKPDSALVQSLIPSDRDAWPPGVVPSGTAESAAEVDIILEQAKARGLRL